MRLAIVTHAVVRGDGQGRVNLEIARAALGRGWSVVLLASRADPSIVDAGATWVRVVPRRLPTALVHGQAFALAATAALRRLRPRPGVTLANGFVMWAQSDINVVHFVHGAWLRSAAYPFRRPRTPYAAYQRAYTELNARLERIAFRESRYLVAVSEKTAVELRALGMPETRIVTIANGVDPLEYRPGPPQRRRWELPDAVPVFLFAGDLRTARKGLDTVLRALARTPQVHLAVAGDACDSPFPALAASLGLERRVHWLGFQRDMPTLMRSVDALVFPSRYESCGLVILEAMASGLPVLTARTAGGSALVGEGGRVLDDPDDVSTLARWMSELAADAVLRRRMGTIGRAIAEQHTWSAMAEQYLELIEQSSRERARG